MAFPIDFLNRSAARVCRFTVPLAMMAGVLLAGCAASTEGMTPAQREAAELRRYCEQNGNDIERCLGFLGDH